MLVYSVSSLPSFEMVQVVREKILNHLVCAPPLHPIFLPPFPQHSDESICIADMSRPHRPTGYRVRSHRHSR